MSSLFERLSSRAPLSLTPSGALQLGGVIHGGALLISSTDVYAWGAANVAGAEADILNFLDTNERQRGEFLLLGTGTALSFPAPAFRAEIDRRGLGLETMDTSAACRTYNVLVAEARSLRRRSFPLRSG